MGFTADWGSTGFDFTGLGTSVDGLFSSGEVTSFISWRKVCASITNPFANATNTPVANYASLHTRTNYLNCLLHVLVLVHPLLRIVHTLLTVLLELHVTPPPHHPREDPSCTPSHCSRPFPMNA